MTNELEEKILSQSKDERILNSTIECFYQDKQELDKYKKSTDSYGKEIKELMQKLNKTEFETDNGLLEAKITIQNREDFNEDKLIQKLKDLGKTDIIQTKEYIDMDMLENAIYQDYIDASELTDCKVSKQVTVLKVSKKKGK